MVLLLDCLNKVIAIWKSSAIVRFDLCGSLVERHRNVNTVLRSDRESFDRSLFVVRVFMQLQHIDLCATKFLTIARLSQIRPHLHSASCSRIHEALPSVHNSYVRLPRIPFHPHTKGLVQAPLCLDYLLE